MVVPEPRHYLQQLAAAEDLTLEHPCLQFLKGRRVRPEDRIQRGEAGGDDTRWLDFRGGLRRSRVGLRERRKGEGAMDGRSRSTRCCRRPGRAAVAQPDSSTAPAGLKGGKGTAERL